MKLRGQKNQCQGCKQYFNSNTAFEMHRTGRHGIDRRCMTRDEMTAKGMSLNAQSFWISERNERFKKESEDDMQEN
jgi:hypothetical protein